MLKAYAFALLSLLTWSLYPVLTAFGILQIDPILFVLLVQVSAGLGAIVFALPFLKHPAAVCKSLFKYARAMPRDNWLFLFIIGLASALFNIFIVMAMTLIEPAAVAIIVQTSPIFTMVFSYYFIRKDWSKLGVLDYTVAAISLCGAAIVVLGNPQSFDDSGSVTAVSFLDNDAGALLPIIGGGLAIMAAVMVAFSNAMRAQISNIVKTIVHKRDIKGEVSVSGAFIGEAICRFFSVIPAFLIWVVWGMADPITGESLAAALFTGFIVFNIASAALTLALLYAKNSSITLISFLGPVVSVFWLSLFGLSTVTPLIIIGMIVIIVGNVSLYMLNRPTRR